MSRIITVALLLVCTSVCSAQSNKQIKDYYSHVYQAEQHIIKKEFAAAAKQYESAAKTGMPLFAIDANNAAVCAAYNKDYEQLTSYAKLLISKGAMLGFFRKDVFDDYLNS